MKISRILAVVLLTLMVSTAWAVATGGWSWIFDDTQAWLYPPGNVEVKQDEWEWVEVDGIPDPYGYVGSVGDYLYQYTVINNTATNVTSFGFTTDWDANVKLVRVGTDAALWGFAVVANPNGVNSPYWATDLGGLGFQQGVEGFQVISTGAPRAYLTAEVDNDGRPFVGGLTTGPTPEPISLALLALGLPLGLLARRRRKED